MTGGAAPLVAALALVVTAPPPADGDPARGERVFQRCYACHSVAASERALLGPSLHCVIGRRAGTLPGFAFSPAMVSAGARRGLSWTRDTLDRFLADPEGLVPGTEMAVPGLPDAADRQDLIAYLARACRGGAGSDRGTGLPRAPASAIFQEGLRRRR